MAQHHLVIGQTVQGLIGVTVGTKNTSIVVHWLNPSSAAVNSALAEQIFVSLKTLWNANLAALCPPSTLLNGVYLRDISTEGNALVSSTGPAAPGTASAADLLPRQIAACLTVRTPKAGKKYRGRMYWPGFAESASGPDQHMTTAAKAALDTFSNGFLTAVNVGQLTFGVAHRPTAFDENTGLPISPGLGFTTPANQVLCRDNVWDNQRRRAG